MKKMSSNFLLVFVVLGLSLRDGATVEEIQECLKVSDYLFR